MSNMTSPAGADRATIALRDYRQRLRAEFPLEALPDAAKLAAPPEPAVAKLNHAAERVAIFNTSIDAAAEAKAKEIRVDDDDIIASAAARNRGEPDPESGLEAARTERAYCERNVKKDHKAAKMAINEARLAMSDHADVWRRDVDKKHISPWLRRVLKAADELDLATIEVRRGEITRDNVIADPRAWNLDPDSPVKAHIDAIRDWAAER